MALEKQNGLFYELLIRGVFEANHPAGPLGSVAAAHYIEGEAVVDTETGEVVQYKPGPATPLPLDKATEFLGEKFAQIEAGSRMTAAALDVARARIAELEKAFAATVEAADAALAAEKAAHANALDTGLRLASELDRVRKSVQFAIYPQPAPDPAK